MTSSAGRIECGYCRGYFGTELQAAEHRENVHAQYEPPTTPLCTDCWREPRVLKRTVCAGCLEKHEAANRAEQRKQWGAIQPSRLRMEDWSLESFPANDTAGKAALKTVEPWLWAVLWLRFDDGKLVPITDDDAVADDHPMWEAYHGEDWNLSLYIYGGVGSGKTGLAWSLLRARVLDARYNHETSRAEWPAFANVVELLDKAKAAMRDGDGGAPLRELYDAGLLVLDDLGAERPTDWALDAIAALVQHRHAQNLPTIVTSNYAPSALVQRLGHKDPMVGRRIVSRLTEDCIKVKLDRPDLRAQQRTAA